MVRRRSRCHGAVPCSTTWRSSPRPLMCRRSGSRDDPARSVVCGRRRGIRRCRIPFPRTGRGAVAGARPGTRRPVVVRRVGTRRTDVGHVVAGGDHRKGRDVPVGGHIMLSAGFFHGWPGWPGITAPLSRRCARRQRPPRTSRADRQGSPRPAGDDATRRTPPRRSSGGARANMKSRNRNPTPGEGPPSRCWCAARTESLVNTVDLVSAVPPVTVAVLWQ